MTEKPRTRMGVVDKQPEADTGSLIQLTSSGPNDVNMQLHMRNVSPLQLWAVAKLLEIQGDALYTQAQMERARVQANAAAPQDHKQKRGKGN